MSKIKQKVVLLTGASSGIGRALAKQLAEEGAILLLTGRNEMRLQETVKGLSPKAQISCFTSDLSTKTGCNALIAFAEDKFSKIDILINNAGMVQFSDFSTESWESREQLFHTNVLAPMQLTRLLLPRMKRNGSGHIVNIGSIFGSIGFAWFSSYSSSKFALRGYSEALRRELDGSGIQISYIAPRATNTPVMQKYDAMNQATSMKLDKPELVANQIIKAIKKGKKDSYIGFPESIFIKINSLFPRLIDHALKKQNAISKDFAENPERFNQEAKIDG